MKIATNNVDLSFLRSVSGGDEIFEKLLLTNAIDDIQTNIDKMQEACDTKNAKDIYTVTHTLKSVLSITGLTYLENLCSKVNNMTKDGDFNSAHINSISDIVSGWIGAKPKLENIIAAYK